MSNTLFQLFTSITLTDQNSGKITSSPPQASDDHDLSHPGRHDKES
jgi:hypothetical protein